MSQIPQPSNKSTNRPIYVVTVLSNAKTKYIYIKTRKDLFNVYAHYVDIRGTVISKDEAEKLKTNKKDRELGDDVMHILIPHHQWIKAENISFNGLANK